MTSYEPETATPTVLVTGATGYIGGRLVPVLEAAGVRLRCVARRPAALASRVSPTTEVVAGDLLDPVSLDHALAGVDVAYYLVHSMGHTATTSKRGHPRLLASRGVRTGPTIEARGGDESAGPRLARF